MSHASCALTIVKFRAHVVMMIHDSLGKARNGLIDPELLFGVMTCWIRQISHLMCLSHKGADWGNVNVVLLTSCES